MQLESGDEFSVSSGYAFLRCVLLFLKGALFKKFWIFCQFYANLSEVKRDLPWRPIVWLVASAFNEDQRFNEVQ